MADSSVVRERIDTVVPEVTGLRRLLTPPTALLPRIRWLFTASAVGLTVLFGVVGAITAASAPATAGRPWVLALTPPIVLIALWLYGYRQQRFTLGMDVVGAAALVALGAALPDNRSMLAATYGSIWVRALYATPRQAAVSTALFVAAFVAAAVLSPAAPDLLGASVLGRAIIGLIFGVIFTLIGTVLATYQRAIVRERRLRRAGHALAEASTRQEIYDAALAGARGLLSTDAGDSHRGVELAIGSESSMAVVGAAGDGAERSIYTLPLVAHGVHEGALVVHSRTALDDELKDDLQTLADLVALAVESQTLLDARAAGDAAGAAAAAPFGRARQTTAVPASAAAPVATPIWRLPHDLPDRVRWAILVAASAMTLWVGSRGLVAYLQTGSVGALVAASAPVWLIAWWVYGYRRASFPLVGDIVISALVAVMLIASDEFVLVQPAQFASVIFRAVYGSRARVLLFTALHVVALLVAVAVSPGRGAGLVDPLTLVAMALALFVLASINHLVAATLSLYERALARERSLRVAGALLVAATDRAHVYAATLDGAQELLRGAPGAAALVAVGSPRAGAAIVDTDDMEVVTATGEHAAHAAGRAIHLKDVAESLRATLHAGDPVDLPRADAVTWQALDLEGAVGSLYAVPLHVRGALEGAIVVATDAPLDAELKDDLQTLGSLAALAVEDIVLIEQR